MSRRCTGSDFGRNLRWMREKKGLSQKELAHRCGIPESSISHSELGRRQPGHVNLIRLADALYCSVDWLMGLNIAEQHEHATSLLAEKMQQLSPDDFALVETIIRRLLEKEA